MDRVGHRQIRSIPAASTTLVHLSMSAAMRALNSLGAGGARLVAHQSDPLDGRRLRWIAATSVFNRIDYRLRQAHAGATSPCHEVKA